MFRSNFRQCAFAAFCCLSLVWVATTAVAQNPHGNGAKNARLKWQLEDPAPTWRYALAAATAPDGDIYLIGGGDLYGLAATVDVFRPHGNKWVAGPPLPRNVYRLAAATGGDGRIYAIGGYFGGYLAFSNSVFALAPGAGRWVEVAPMPTARQSPAAATGLDGRIYVAGGSTVLNFAVNPLNALEIYNPWTGQWTFGAPMPTPRYDAGMATANDGRIFVIGGMTVDAISSVVEVYTPSTNTWTAAAPVPPPQRAIADAVTGPDGRIYLIGGCEIGVRPEDPTDCGSTKRVDAYTPWTNTWERVEPTLETHREGAVAASGKRIYALCGLTTAAESAR
jgi:N-acetylneuraminic acid mutarotase